MYLQDIYPNYAVEDENYECKARLNRDDSLSWLKTVCGFANNKGGTIFLGVEDKTNKLIGFELNDIDSEKLYIYREIKEHFDTLPSIEIELLPYQVNDKKRYIIKLDVAESPQKPIVLKYKGIPIIFVRRDGFTNIATTEEIIWMARQGEGPRFDLGESMEKYDENDFKKLHGFYEKRVGKKLKEKDLASINFFDDNRFLKRGSLLFKDNYSGEETKITCSSFRGFTRGDDGIIISNSFSGNLIDGYEFIYEFVSKRMNHGFIKLPTSRIDIQSYPERSLFEAIINSLAHRDYYINGTGIYVDLFINRLVITSPGGLFGSPEFKKTYKLDSFASKRRNNLISDVFILCKAMEAKGTGFGKITEDYKDADESHKPFVFSKNNQFSIVLPDLTYEKGISMDDDSIKLTEQIEGETKYDVPILSYCFSKYRSAKDIATYLNLSNSTFLRKNIIASLVDKKYLLEMDADGTKMYIANKDKVLLR